MMPEHIRVLLVDDHTIVRQGLRGILATDEEIEVVSYPAGRAGHGGEREKDSRLGMDGLRPVHLGNVG
jgi:DNA-binding NarL/FixJ family response regulator